MKKILQILLVLLLFQGCKDQLQTTSGLEDVEVRLIEKNEELVKLEIMNASGYTLNMESTWHLFIEKKNGDIWERVGYVPCQCGTPCQEPQPVRIKPGDSKLVEWELVSRGCKMDASGIPETIEKKVNSGVYRLKFTMNPEQNGIRLNPEILKVDFKVRRK